MSAAVLTRTLDAELQALVAGEAAECLVCGEDVELGRSGVECPACGTVVRSEEPGARSGVMSGSGPAVQLRLQAG